jgi:protein-tyrosine phosphatase
MIRRATVVLTASRSHRDHVTALWPQALERVFTMRELAWLLHDVHPDDLHTRRLTERLEELSALARRRRGKLPLLAPEEFDIADPVGGSDSDFTRAAADIEEALAAPLGVL